MYVILCVAVILGAAILLGRRGYLHATQHHWKSMRWWSWRNTGRHAPYAKDVTTLYMDAHRPIPQRLQQATGVYAPGRRHAANAQHPAVSAWALRQRLRRGSAPATTPQVILPAPRAKFTAKQEQDYRTWRASLPTVDPTQPWPFTVTIVNTKDS